MPTELGYVRGRQGAAAESLRQHKGALAKAIGLRSTLDIVRAAIGLATAHAADGDGVISGHLVGYVDAKLLTLGHTLSVRDRKRLDGVEDRVFELLGGGTAANWSTGADMSRTDLLALAT